MSGLTYTKACATSGRLLALTGLEPSEFKTLLPFFQKALENHLETVTVEGKQREGKSFSVYKNALLPTTEDKLLFVLTFVKQNLIQEVMGALFDMSQPKVNDWLQRLVVVLREALRQSGDAPSRTVQELKTSMEAENSPLFVWTLRNVPSPDQPTSNVNAIFTVERRSATPSKTRS